MRRFIDSEDISWREAVLIMAITLVLVYIFSITIRAAFHIGDAAQLYLATVVQDLTIIGLIAFFLRKLHQCPWQRISLRMIDFSAALRSVIWGVAVLFLMSFLMVLLNHFLPGGLPPQNVESLLHFGPPPVAFAVAMFLMAILAPIAEEMLFRGYLYQALKRQYNMRMAMLTTSIAFALIHADVYRFVPLLIGGYVLNLVAEREKSIVASIITHATWNACMLAMAFINIVPK